MKTEKIVIIILSIMIIVAGVSGYYLGKNSDKRVNKGNFQINQTAIDEANNFFASNPSQDDITNYCQTNRIGCMNYCRTNNNQEICAGMMGGRNYG